MVVEQASGGTIHVNVMVVPLSVPQMAVFPNWLLLTNTFTPLGPQGLGLASVAPVIVPVIVSPACTIQWVLLNGWPVSVPGRMPVGLASDPAPWPESMKVVCAVPPDTWVAVSVKRIPRSSGNTVKSVFTKSPLPSAMDSREMSGSTWGYSVNAIETASLADHPVPVMVTMLPGG
jgi:hypothetical protein